MNELRYTYSLNTAGVWVFVLGCAVSVVLGLCL